MSIRSRRLPLVQRFSLLALALLVVVVPGCGGGGSTAVSPPVDPPGGQPGAQAWVWDLPPGFSPPVVPAEPVQVAPRFTG